MVIGFKTDIGTCECKSMLALFCSVASPEDTVCLADSGTSLRGHTVSLDQSLTLSVSLERQSRQNWQTKSHLQLQEGIC